MFEVEDTARNGNENRRKPPSWCRFAPIYLASSNSYLALSVSRAKMLPGSARSLESSQFYSASRSFLHEFASRLCIQLVSTLPTRFGTLFVSSLQPVYRQRASVLAQTSGKLAVNLHHWDWGGRLVALFAFWHRMNRFYDAA